MREHACVPWAGGTHPGGREVRAAAPEESTGRHPSRSGFRAPREKKFYSMYPDSRVWFPKNTLVS